jgi:hypothetical protein
LALLSGAVVVASLLGLILTQRASGPPPERAFYFWKTRWQGSPEILQTIRDNGVKRFYMRFFDVAWDDAAKAPQPVSPLEFASPPPGEVELVPVVFLVNAVFLNIPDAKLEELAGHVWKKASGMAQQQSAAFHQLQIDCDWSDGSRKKYFRFAELLGRKAEREGKILSATIRLHQIKYKERTGIPPVSRGMLMFYNFGKIEADAARNSIFNTEDAERYASYIAAYPLNLDVSLPVFSWSVHSRDGQVLGLLEKVGTAEVSAFDGFQPAGPNRFTASRSFFFRGSYFREGDRILVEETTPDMTRQAATLAHRGSGRKGYGTVALFDLDERHLETYGKEKIAKVWETF